MKNYQFNIKSNLQILLICTVSIFFSSAAYAADGDVDTSFGTNGIVNEGAPFQGFETVVVQPDGKILAAGRVLLVTPTFAVKAGIVRYNPNGTPDTSFGTNGKVIVDVAGGTLDFPTLIAQPDGKFIIVGRFVPTTGSSKIGLARFNADGSFDTSFGTNGLTVSNFPEGNTNSQSDAVLQPDGKIVVSGSWRGTAFCVARWNANGSLDTGFGTTNGETCVNTNGTGSTQSIVLQSDGKIVMSGRRTSSFTVPFDFIVFRFNQNGTPDTSFDGDGYVLTDLNGGNDNALSVIVRPNGKILAIGSARAINAPDTGFGLVQYNADGSLDASFGTAGKSLVTFAGGETFVEDFPAALQSNGKVVVGRSRRRESPNIGNESQIARFNENGTLDATFGAGGQIIFLPIQNVLDLVLQTDGKIVAVGTNQPGNSITARFLNTATPPVNNAALKIADFDGDGRTDASVFRNGVWYINSSGAARSATAPQAAYAVQFGTTTDKLVPADYDGDSKTDIAVWRAGDLAYFYILNSSNNTFRAEQFGRTGDNPIVVGNWDADNKADLAVYRNGLSTGEPSLFFYRPSSQSAIDFETVYWGTTGDEAVRGDFDGDGKLDAAVFRASNNIWYIRQSSNNQARYENWGAASDNRVAGDFDGDGKTDLAIFRDGLWAILQSSNNQQRYDSFGQAGDRVAAGDYDGDGKTDIAVFRSGVFYIKQSTSSQSAAQAFGAAGDMPIAAAFVQ